MPLPRQLAEFNRNGANRLFRMVATWLPPFIMMEHRGRSSGRPYRTPMMGFFTDDELLIALTYGPDVEWRKNLEAAGGGQIVSRNRRRAIGPPRLEHGIARATGIPWPVRRFLPLIKVDDYLRLPLLPTATGGQTDA